jgi:hypothetical protein
LSDLPVDILELAVQRDDLLEFPLARVPVVHALRIGGDVRICELSFHLIEALLEFGEFVEYGYRLSRHSSAPPVG